MTELKDKKGLEEVIRMTVDGMIPRNKLRKDRMKRLSITL
jgi:ribosomal protein L13